MNAIKIFDFLSQKSCMFNKTILYLCAVNLVETCVKVKKISAESGSKVINVKRKC
jgi:hypothetical protein